jgi:hypothetical protein
MVKYSKKHVKLEVGTKKEKIPYLAADVQSRSTGHFSLRVE